MKQLYRYYPDFDNEDNLVWYVQENATGLIMGEYFFEEDAQAVCYFFESGNGFAGFTPAFILVKTPPVDIDEAFAAEFA